MQFKLINIVLNNNKFFYSTHHLLTSTSSTSINFPQDPEINTDYPKTEHKYHVEFQFLKAAPPPIQCESPALSIPTISLTSVDGSKSVVYEEGTAANEDIHSDGDSGELLWDLCHLKNSPNVSIL